MVPAANVVSTSPLGVSRTTASVSGSPSACDAVSPPTTILPLGCTATAAAYASCPLGAFETPPLAMEKVTRPSPPPKEVSTAPPLVYRRTKYCLGVVPVVSSVTTARSSAARARSVIGPPGTAARPPAPYDVSTAPVLVSRVRYCPAAAETATIGRPAESAASPSKSALLARVFLPSPSNDRSSTPALVNFARTAEWTGVYGSADGTKFVAAR